MTDNLLERLRSRKLDIDPVGNEGTLPVNPDGEEAANYIEELGAILADAYGAFLDWDELLKSRADQEAVARIEALEAENARLVARLEVYEGAQSGPIKTTGVVDSLGGAVAALDRKLARAIQTALEMAATECHRAAYGGQYPQDDQIELGCLRALDNVNAIRVEDVLEKMEASDD